ncbi:MAG: shikimate kinase [Clostridia bacterium]|nr:shikimate kinase [Clostridia bacterium]
MFGLLGRKLSHSLSPEIHSVFGDYEYELFEREENELDAFFADTSIDAFNVTIPYKVEAYNRCDVLDETAREIGSVNTVVRKDGRLFGYNTDLYGFKYMVKKLGADFAGRKVLVLGSGGASKTAVAASRRLGAKETFVISRTGENNYDNLEKNYDTAIIVNTTPVGMFPENGKAPLKLKYFKNIEFVIDLIYNPCMTALLLEAKKLGIPYINGLPMLAAQALRSAEHFFSKVFDNSLIDKAVDKITADMKNIVLIGMPGCGKTTLGTYLAEKMGRECVDTDDIIVAKDGRNIPEIFSSDGENYFRDIESEAVAECGKRLGIIIATGGGAVMREENRDALAQNGIIIYLRRNIEGLATGGRPLSAGENAVYEIFSKRRETYESFADYIIDVDRDVAVTAERLSKCVSLY